jgi:hypothetical protein
MEHKIIVDWCENKKVSLRRQLELFETGTLRWGENVGSGWILRRRALSASRETSPNWTGLSRSIATRTKPPEALPTASPADIHHLGGFGLGGCLT